jgi:hypothetical protein
MGHWTFTAFFVGFDVGALVIYLVCRRSRRDRRPARWLAGPAGGLAMSPPSLEQMAAWILRGWISPGDLAAALVRGGADEATAVSVAELAAELADAQTAG